jgi:pilus assembly protein Flp/PilA
MTQRGIAQAKNMRIGFAYTLRRFAADRAGATAVEYGLFLALVGLALAAGISLVGGGLVTVFTNLATALGG